MYSPCYKCEQRHMNCHSHCGDYKEYKTKLDKISKVKFIEACENKAVRDSLCKATKRRLYCGY